MVRIKRPALQNTDRSEICWIDTYSCRTPAKTVGEDVREVVAFQPFQPAPMPEGRSLLLDLPPEIRNLIYEILAATTGAEVTNRKGLSVASLSGLIGANRQIYEEFGSVLPLTASPVTFSVKDFDFSHVVKFLNRFSEKDLQTLPKTGMPGYFNYSKRRLRIVLEVTAVCSTNPEKLHSWLCRVDDPNKKGYGVAFEYRAKASCDSYGDFYGPFREPKLLAEGHIISLITKLGIQIGKLEDGRTRKEANDIRDALKGALLPFWRSWRNN